MEDAIKKFLDLAGLTEYNTKITAFISGAIDTAKTAVKDELIGGASGTYDTLKEIETYITEHQSEYEALMALVNNNVTKEEFSKEIAKIATNTAAIAKLNGEEETEGSVKYTAKSYADTAKSEAEASANSYTDTKAASTKTEAIEGAKTYTDSVKSTLEAKIEGLDIPKVDAISTEEIDALFED